MLSWVITLFVLVYIYIYIAHTSACKMLIFVTQRQSHTNLGTKFSFMYLYVYASACVRARSRNLRQHIHIDTKLFPATSARMATLIRPWRCYSRGNASPWSNIIVQCCNSILTASVLLVGSWRLVNNMIFDFARTWLQVTWAPSVLNDWSHDASVAAPVCRAFCCVLARTRATDRLSAWCTVNWRADRLSSAMMIRRPQRFLRNAY